MACERYKDWVTHAALDALPAGREAEWRGHLETCPGCRAALERERRLLRAIDRGLAASVDTEPSPEFAARVRQRIAAEPAGWSLWLPRWLPSAAGAIAVLALLGVWFAIRAPRPPLGVLDTREALVIAREPVPRPAPERTAGPVRPSEPQSPRAGRGDDRPEPEVLVPPGQWEAMMQLYNAAQQGRVDAGALFYRRALLEQVAAELVPPAELKVKPLEVIPLDAPRGAPQRDTG